MQEPNPTTRDLIAAIRTVDRMWRPEPVLLAPVDLAEYTAHRPYAVAVDRQSDHTQLTLAERTGQENRVRKILAQAHSFGLSLPPPEECGERREGELQYRFDSRFWFVDGIGRPATGFSSSPEARPEMWRALLTLVQLVGQRIGPEWVLVGEATRYFRDEDCISLWTKALWAKGLRLYICGFGEVNRYTLSGLIAYITACSGWLVDRRKEARESRKRRGELFYKKNLEFGLEAFPDGRGVRTNPREWAALKDVVERLAAGEITTAGEAVRHLAAHHRDADGSPLSVGATSLRRWIDGRKLEGIYEQYGLDYTPRMIEDEHYLRRDLDMTPSGRRRYLIERGEALAFPIHYTHDAERIAPETLESARRALLGTRGRPAQEVRMNPLTQEPALLSQRVLRCAACGAAVIEAPPRRTTEHPRALFSYAQDVILLERRAAGYSWRETARAVGEQFARETGQAVPTAPTRARDRWRALELTGNVDADRRRVRDFWLDPFRPRVYAWRLHCTCARRVAYTYGIPPEEAEKHPDCAHVRSRTGYLSGVVWEALLAALRAHPPLVTPPQAEVDAVRRAELERERAAIDEDLQTISFEVRQGLHGRPDDPHTLRRVGVLRAPLEARYEEITRLLDASEADILERQSRYRDDRMLREEFDAALISLEAVAARTEEEARRIHDIRTAIVHRFVHTIAVHLETGAFTIHTAFRSEPLREIHGAMPPLPLDPPPSQPLPAGGAASSPETGSPPRRPLRGISRVPLDSSIPAISRHSSWGRSASCSNGLSEPYRGNFSVCARGWGLPLRRYSTPPVSKSSSAFFPHA